MQELPSYAPQQAFLTHKEKVDYELAIRLRRERKINEPGQPFEASDKEEIQPLLSAGVIEPIIYSEAEHGLLIYRMKKFFEFYFTSVIFLCFF